ncbi:MAG: hypothetical protein NTY42_10570 [Planctomycetota bacterium]|nr:hypothetical protein [Planctomycetota bacterium]
MNPFSRLSFSILAVLLGGCSAATEDKGKQDYDSQVASLKNESSALSKKLADLEDKQKQKDVDQLEQKRKDLERKEREEAEAARQESIRSAIQTKIEQEKQQEREARIMDVAKQTASFLRPGPTMRFRRALDSAKNESARKEDVSFLRSWNRGIEKIADGISLDENDRSFFASIGLEYWGTESAKSMHLKLMKIAADNLDRPDIENDVRSAIHAVVKAYGYDWEEAAQFGDWFLSQQGDQTGLAVSMLQIAEEMRQERDVQKWVEVESELDNPFVWKELNKYLEKMKSPEFALRVAKNEYQFWNSVLIDGEKLLKEIESKPENKRKKDYIDKLEKEILRLEKSTNIVAYRKKMELEKERDFLTKGLDPRIEQVKFQMESAKEKMARIFPDGLPKN